MLRRCAVILLLAGCGTPPEPLTSVVPLTGSAQPAEYHDAVAVRTYLRQPEGSSTTELEIIGATCAVRVGAYAATVMTPAGVEIPRLSEKPDPIEVDCTLEGYAPGRASVPARRDRVTVREYPFGVGVGVGIGHGRIGWSLPEYRNVYLDSYSYPTARVLLSPL